METTTTDISPARALRLLIVDDSATMRMMLKRAARLTEVPIEAILEAANGEEALNVLASQPIDILFTDINMPVMNGVELLRRVNDCADYADLLRVIISTDGSDARRSEVQGLNVHTFLKKPFPPEMMRDVLETVSSNADAC